MNPFNVDKIYCLCLDKRKDLWGELKADCERRGWDFTPFVAGDGTDPLLTYDLIDSTDFNPNTWGYGIPDGKIHHFNAFRCHQEMIRRCKQEGVKSVLMMEDDAYITYRFDTMHDYLSSQNVLPLDFHLLYLGWWQGEHKDGMHAGVNLEIEKNWAESGQLGIGKVTQVGGLHGVIIHESLFDLILSMPPNNPVDFQINRFGHRLLNSYFIYPKMIGVRSCYSFTEKAFFQRDEL